MTPERWQHIARIYELAVDQDLSARDKVLSEACAGDETLRREVELLLRQETAQVVVDRPMWATAALLFDDGPDLRPGATLGPYRVEGPLGAGGMGEVFRGTDTRLNRPVAIKVLSSSAAIDQQMRARFAREAKAVAALTHPHICTLYDVGRHDEVDFLVMEHLEGDTLAARLADGPLSLDMALTLRERDRRRARPRASPRSHPSGSETRQYHADRERREAPRFWSREIPAGRRYRCGRAG